ncbi:MAG: two-component system, chemotaxis family, protein-glutamate methylesterase/glutaminase [Gaiellaceae bacterium]|jgi:two-component system chemotaxis response regulator CheB|nr:two-component system, chemotaxis family, protein-glutamate methylesterase/glutaminase [Gaiellaceae bacterium]
MRGSGEHGLVAIGASWGGLDVLRDILRDLPAELNAGVLIAQHRSPGSHPTAMRDLLGAVTRMRVAEANDKDEIRSGTAYIAAPDYHLLVEPGQMTLSTDEPVHYARPSIDVLFETAAESYRDRCIGVVLTGANDDGARGLARVVELGGTAIVQDPETAQRDEMPLAALRSTPSARVMPVAEIAALLVELCGLARVSV